MIVKQLDNRNRFDVYDRKQDTEGTTVLVTATGTEILVNEDCYRGIDIMVTRAGNREVMSWSDEYPNTPTRHYTFSLGEWTFDALA